MKIISDIIVIGIIISIGWAIIGFTRASFAAAARSKAALNNYIENKWHNILQISPNSSIDEIKHAYRKRMSEYHPDKTAKLGIKLQDLAKIESQKINAAYKYAMSLKR
jgi:DnaJ-domain-containing protein 1